MTSRFSNAMVTGDLEKKNVGKTLIERRGQEKLGDHDYKQSFQNILLQRGMGRAPHRESELKFYIFFYFLKM